MAIVDTSGRIRLEADHDAPIEGWAVLVNGKTHPDHLYIKRELAEASAAVDHLSKAEIIPIRACGKYVERLD